MNIIGRSRSNTPRKHVDSPRRIGPDAQRRRLDRPFVAQLDIDTTPFKGLMEFVEADGRRRFLLHVLGVGTACQEDDAEQETNR